MTLTVWRIALIVWGVLIAAYFVWMVVVFMRGPYE